MVEWLREVGMPADYVNKLSRMFQDMKVSEDLNSTFKDARRKEEATNAGIYMKYLCILTSYVDHKLYVTGPVKINHVSTKKLPIFSVFALS